MSEDKKYNGWNSYETWLVNLWLSNSQGDDEYIRDMAQNNYNDAESSTFFTKDEQARIDLADSLKDYVESLQNEMGYNKADMFTDMINAALREVDWHDLAEHYLDDVDKESQEEAETTEE